jgi:ubiquinone/menaquinone biosynthesis C-methylase UbiE
MNHQDHLNLIRDGIANPGGLWADLGSGWGAFTLALAELTGPTAEIYSIDKDRNALKKQERNMRSKFPDRLSTRTHYLVADFTKPLRLSPLDGVLMANTLHFQRNKVPVLKLIYSYLKPGARLILVEYNLSHGNPWIPFPVSYPAWQDLASRVGFAGTHLLATRSSSSFGEIYSAISFTRPQDP